MNGERAILFATDPPYLVDYDGSNHPTRNKDWSASYGVTWDDSSQGAELYDGFIAAAVAEAIAEDAAWYCWHASRRQAMLEACWEKAGAFVHQQIIWVKDRGVLTRSHYLWKHEPCFMGWRRPNRPPKVAEETLPSTWALPSFAKDERPDHPTPKPLDAFGIPMRQHVARGGLCYEPFSGSGSQIMAGEANGRRVFAMEISPAYVDVAVERWQADTGRDAILDGDGRTFAQVRGRAAGRRRGGRSAGCVHRRPAYPPAAVLRRRFPRGSCWRAGPRPRREITRTARNVRRCRSTRCWGGRSGWRAGRRRWPDRRPRRATTRPAIPMPAAGRWR
jgi:DNA modification methylase